MSKAGQLGNEFFFFKEGVKINVPLPAAKCACIPPYQKKRGICLYVTFVSLCVCMQACQGSESPAKWKLLQTIQLRKIPPGVSETPTL